MVVVVVIAQQLFSYRQLSRLRKFATAGGFDSWKDALRSVVPLHTPDRHLICRWWCGPCNCSKADSDQNATGWQWYGLSEAADFQEVRYRVVKLQGLCLVQNSLLLLRLLGWGEYVDNHGKCQHLWCLHLREVQERGTRGTLHQRALRVSRWGRQSGEMMTRMVWLVAMVAWTCCPWAIPGVKILAVQFYAVFYG